MRRLSLFWGINIIPLNKLILNAASETGACSKKKIMNAGALEGHHTVHALESGSVILEMKDGPYEPLGPEDVLAL